MYSKETLQIVKRLQRARISLMKKQPFYAVLLLHMQFSLDPMCETVYTDGERIVFCPDFLNKISDKELEYVLMHEALHIALNHCKRKMKDYDFDDYGTACDIVVNSNILFSCNNDLSAITLKEYGEGMHISPDGKEGYYYTVEEVYQMIREIHASQNKKSNDEGTEMPDEVRNDGGFDDHTFWEEEKDSAESPSDTEEEWIQRMIEAAQLAEKIQERNPGMGGSGCGRVPAGVRRIVESFTKPQMDWRTILDMFVQEEITDYSFSPPDRRFQDSPFLLPDFNEKEESVKDILFMIDTSGSMSLEMIRQAFSEIKGAIDQFDGHLSGWLGFFDAKVVPAKPFESEDDFKIIKAEGGGGTSFQCIFEYIKERKEQELDPVSIIILTDGCAPFPEEEDAMGIPVLWVINNEEITPPWGKIARMQIN